MREPKAGTMAWARRIAARLWCDRYLETYEMDAEAAEKISRIIVGVHEKQRPEPRDYSREPAEDGGVMEGVDSP